MSSESVRDQLLNPKPIIHEIPREDYLSSGSTLLNLACSGTSYGALAKGHYFWMVGDSSSGKTWLTLGCLAEASINPHFDDYDLIFNNVELGALMDVEKYFGRKLAERLRAPDYKNGEPVYSRTIEDFYFHLDDRLTAVENGKAPPFIELLDSADALTSTYERKKFQEKKEAARNPRKKAAGDYGDGKAKINSTYLREVVSRLGQTGCILIILNQTRDILDSEKWGDTQTHAGGHALKFYATWQLWSSVASREWKTVNSIDRQIGIISRIKIKKNRLTGKEWTVKIPIYHSFGIDDIGGMVDYLVEEKHWKKADSGGVITADSVEYKGTKRNLIKHIEKNNLEDKLKSTVVDVWESVEDACRVDRKSRY